MMFKTLVRLFSGLLLFSAALSITTAQMLPPGDNCYVSLGEWTKATAAPANHLEAATAVVNGKLFVISGFKDTSLRVSRRVDVYNPATDIWETVANPRRPTPTGFSHAQAAVDGQYIWIAGGFVGNHPAPASDEVWKYDTVEDLWYPAQPLPEKRAGGLLVLEGRNLHYMGGTSVDRTFSYPDHWILNIDTRGASWTRAADLPQARLHLSGAVINGVIYAVGGQFRHDHNPIDLAFLHAYHPTTDSWERKTDLLFPRSHFEPGTMIINGKIVIVGGRANQSGEGNGQLKQITLYDPKADTWRELRELPIKLIAPVAAQIGNQLIVTGGGVNWNTPQAETFVSQINCEKIIATVTPVTRPTATPTPGISTGQQVTSLTLINVDTQTDITELTAEAIIDCAAIGTSNLNIRANTLPETVGSVVFALDNMPRYSVENGAPYALGKNDGSAYRAWIPPDGQHTLIVTAYGERRGAGTPSSPFILNFTAVNCSTASLEHSRP